MNTRRAASVFFVATVTALGLTGCLTAVKEVTSKALEDRTHADHVKDTDIESGVVSRITQAYRGKALDLDVTVWEGRVLLTGTTDDPTVMDRIGELAAQGPNIRELYNEIQMVSTDEFTRRLELRKSLKERQERGGLQEQVDDWWISQKITGKLLSNPGVKSVNYRWESVRGTVYVIGRARSQEEVARVLETIRNTNGVQEVKSFIEVKPV
ncbi:MAG: BON domain-containing protein [Nitrospirales bacterium]